MDKSSTLILKGVIFIIAITVLGLCTIAIPAGIMTDNIGAYRPILFGLYIPAIPFYIALYQALKLLRRIDSNQAFSEESIAALKNIKYCAIAISAMFAVGMPYIFYVADNDDTPGVALIGFVIIGASFVIATFAALMQKLIQNAVEIKSENDLTV